MILRKIFIIPIKFYRYFISPFFPSSCRFVPTCSEFAINSIENFGIYRGSIMTIKRLSMCHPWQK